MVRLRTRPVLLLECMWLLVLPQAVLPQLGLLLLASVTVLLQAMQLLPVAMLVLVLLRRPWLLLLARVAKLVLLLQVAMLLQMQMAVLLLLLRRAVLLLVATQWRRHPKRHRQRARRVRRRQRHRQCGGGIRRRKWHRQWRGGCVVQRKLLLRRLLLLQVHVRLTAGQRLLLRCRRWQRRQQRRRQRRLLPAPMC